MGAPSKHRLYTIEEYVRLEEFANVRHEFLDGQIYAMAGGTPEHAALAMRVGIALGVQLAGRPCNVYSSDVRIRVVATGLDTYPDLAVVCGGEQRDAEDPLALTNPVLLVEVTSPSTAAYDRGQKLDHYHRIPALREVLLVSHERPLLELWRRTGDVTWERVEATGGAVLELASLGCTLDVDALYRDPFATAAQ
jgi:Uma2 family endonuclease